MMNGFDQFWRIGENKMNISAYLCIYRPKYKADQDDMMGDLFNCCRKERMWIDPILIASDDNLCSALLYYAA